MDLQISVFLLFVLFTAGHSFSCYHCNGTDTCEQTTCNESSCFAATTYFDDNRTVVKSCFLSNGCPSGSINLGIMKASFYCCDTDLCNTQNAPDPSNNTFNGKMCYSCDEQSCSNTVNCSGSEDRCFIATGTYASKGCVSKVCAATTLFPLILNLTCCEGDLCNRDNVTQSITQSTTQGFSSTQSTTQGLSSTQSSGSIQSTTQSLSSTQSTTQSTTQSANSANSITQSFLFLCCSLLSFILLH